MESFCCIADMLSKTVPVICCSRMHTVSRFGLYYPNHDWLHRALFGNSYTKTFALTLLFGAGGLELAVCPWISELVYL